MTSSNTVKSLARKHAEIQGNIQQVEASLDGLENTLNAVEISIQLFDPDYKTHKINARRSNNKTVTLSRGESSKCSGLIDSYQSIGGKIHQSRGNKDHQSKKF